MKKAHSPPFWIKDHPHALALTFLDNDVDWTLALQIPLIFDGQREFICSNLKSGNRSYAAVAVLQFHTIWASRVNPEGLNSLFIKEAVALGKWSDSHSLDMLARWYAKGQLKILYKN